MTKKKKFRTDQFYADDWKFDPRSLVGSCLHDLSERNGRPDVRQGVIVAEPAPGVYLVEWFNWIGGDSTFQTLVTLEDMISGEFQFYDTDDWMNATYEHAIAPSLRARNRPEEDDRS